MGILGVYGKTDGQKIAKLAELVGLDVKSFREKYPKFFSNDQKLEFFQLRLSEISEESLSEAYEVLTTRVQEENATSLLEQLNNCES